MSTLIRISITFNGTNKTVSKIPKEYLWLRSLKVKNIKSKNKKYYEAVSKIDNIYKKIRQDKIKLKIKLKIQKKGMLIRHVYWDSLFFL